MAKKLIDRGAPFSGENTTVKDIRLDSTTLRRSKNYRLPDGRPERRPGFGATQQIAGVHGNMLMKHTATITEYEQLNDTTRKIKRLKTPLSYGLLKWHDDFQLKTTRDWTLEFLVQLGDLEILETTPSSWQNLSIGMYNGTDRIFLRPTPGAVIFDQTLISNKHVFKYLAWGASAQPSNAAASGNLPPYCDVFALSTISLSVDQGGFWTQMALIDNGNIYYPYDYNFYAPFIGTETYGSKTFHMAYTYVSATRTLTWYINGQIKGSRVIPANHYFAGERDAINGLTTAIQRDFVLLNESTVRGGYNSTCRLNAASIGGSGIAVADHGYYTLPHYYRDDNSANTEIIPWAHSPSRGTGIAELRFWHVARTAADISNFMLDSLASSDMDPVILKGYWRLDDGGPICQNALPSNHKHITTHHGIPGYVSDANLINGVGLLLADGQCLKLSYDEADRIYVRDSHMVLYSITRTDTTTPYTADQDFVIQIQIRTPATFQQELNKFTGAPTMTGASRDTRDSVNYTPARWTDGTFVGVQVQNEAGVAANIYPSAYDSTLFSIEGTVVDPGAGGQSSSLPDKKRVPLIRGLLTPAGKFVFEYFAQVGANPRLYRLTSATTLLPDTVYTLTFDRRTVYVKDLTLGNEGKAIPSGVALALYLDNSTTADATVTITGVNATPMTTKEAVDVVIGASFFNDASDRSIRRGAEFELHQRFMSPYQDQPGFFSLGFFRMWAGSIPVPALAKYANAILAQTDIYGKSLLYNIEIDAGSGPTVVSKTPYADAFQLAYKGWGDPEPQSILGTDTAYPGSWAMEDRLGYGKLPSTFAASQEASCTGLMSYSSVLRQTRGLLSIFGSCVQYSDNNNTGSVPLMMSCHGLLNDFKGNSIWRGTSIGERTIISSSGGYLKVYNGKTFSRLGLGEWSGGNPKLDTNTAGGSLTVDKWYAVRLVYVSEEFGLRHISPVSVVYASGANLQVQIRNIPAHPDPRIDSIQIYVSGAQDSKALAKTAILYPLLTGPIQNKFRPLYIHSDPTNIVASAPLDIAYTAAPNCAYTASLNNRLYAAGDPLLPDAVYWSDAVNPEQFNTVTNYLIIDEATGDKINGLLALFATLYVFKANSIWRVTEVSPGQHQQEKVADVGAISDRSITVITMPDTGRTGIVFWSHYGPYLFDGINLQYLGYPIEGEGTPYSWLDPNTVFVAHDVLRRELLFFYKSRTGTTTSPIYDKSVVYNYRFNSWVEYNGLSMSSAISLTFYAKETGSYGQFIQDYKLILGGINGLLHEWGTADTDGVPTVMSNSYVHTISGVSSSNTFTCSTLPTLLPHALRGVWVTIVKEDLSKWVTLPIVDSSSGSVTIDTSYISIPWTISAKDTAYFGLPAAELETVWDSLELPQRDKKVVRLTTWNVKPFLMAYSTDWRSDVNESWKYIDDASSQRKHTSINSGSCESFKLRLTSFEPGSKLLGFTYEVEFAGEATKPQSV